jgi:K+ transporter
MILLQQNTELTDLTRQMAERIEKLTLQLAQHQNINKTQSQRDGELWTIITQRTTGHQESSCWRGSAGVVFGDIGTSPVYAKNDTAVIRR